MDYGGFMLLSMFVNVIKDWLTNKPNKNDVIQGAGELGQNDVNLGQANSTGMLLDPKSIQR
jgi:hypothetical protein